MGRSSGHLPMRTCVSCRAKRIKRDLARFVLDQEGRPVQDHAFRMKGRGAYTCKREMCMEGAGNFKKIHRALRRLSTRDS